MDEATYIWRIYDPHTGKYRTSGSRNRGVWVRPGYAKYHADRINRLREGSSLPPVEVHKFKLERVEF